ncbi:MAG: hypothetical protein LQ349_008488 [Xanthoria aureola]|nr:MAG: hypothetical protein LQ349_008488 [Xanthoria aureola]
MVNYYAVLDAFPQMTHRELLDAHTNILGKIHVGYGRHQVDEDLVEQAWRTLGDRDRRRQYHLRLGLTDPPVEETHHNGHRTTQSEDTTSNYSLFGGGHVEGIEAHHEDHDTNTEGTQTQDATSDDGSRVVQDPDFLLDDPFTKNKGHSIPNHPNKHRVQDPLAKSVVASALPPMRTFRNNYSKSLAAAPPASSSTTNKPSRQGLPNTPNTIKKQHIRKTDTLLVFTPKTNTIVQQPTSSVREDIDKNRKRITNWINDSAKRPRDDDTDSEDEGVAKSGCWTTRNSKHRQTESVEKDRRIS